MMILYINCCPRDGSRTDRLARKLLDTLGDYKEVNLEKEHLTPMTREKLKYRTERIAQKDYSDPVFDYA